MTRFDSDRTVLTNSCDSRGSDTTDICYRSLQNLYSWDIFDFNETNYSVRAGLLHHRIPSFGFVVTEKDKPGKLDASGLQKDFNIKPGPLFSQIKSGKVVELNDGRKIFPDGYLDPPISGRKVAIFGDTCNSYEMDFLTKNADVLVHEATMENCLMSKAIEYGHSTPDMAAKFSVLTNAKTLCITHVSPRYRPVGVCNENCNELSQQDHTTAKILRKETERYLKRVNSEIQVVIAEDFMAVPVLRAK